MAVWRGTFLSCWKDEVLDDSFKHIEQTVSNVVLAQPRNILLSALSQARQEQIGSLGYMQFVYPMHLWAWEYFGRSSA